jgi:hypothetical protein
VNGVSVLSMNHDDVKALIQNAEDTLELEIERLAQTLKNSAHKLHATLQMKGW